MTNLPHDDERLTTLLRALPAPEPPPDLLAGAQRRYREALDARYRREILKTFAATAVGLVLPAIVLLSLFEPSALIAGAAVAAADAARWMTGMAVVLSIVPLGVWASVLMGFAGSLVPVVLL